MRAPYFLTYLFLLFLMPYAGAQVNYKFHKLGVENGLSQNVVTSITQDKQGFMWFGTMSGLNKYDGYAFVPYQFNPRDTNSLTESWINSLFCTKDGDILAGTRYGGLNRFDPVLNKFTRYLTDINRKNSLSDNVVNCAIETGDGRVWVGTNNGLNLSQGKQDDFQRFFSDEKDPGTLPANKITCLYEDKKGNLWIAAGNNCITEYNSRQKKFIRHPDPEFPDKKYTVKTIQTYFPGVLIVGTTVGVRFFDTYTKRFTNDLFGYPNADALLNNEITSVTRDKSQRVWCGIRFSQFSFGLACIDPLQKTISYLSAGPNTTETVTHENINAMYTDYSDVVWLGFNGQGINYFHPVPPKFFLLSAKSNTPQHLSSEYVYAVEEAQDGSVWIGTIDKGINHYFPETGKIEVFNSGLVFSNWCSDLEPQDDGTVWAAFRSRDDEGGVILFDPKTRSYKTFDEISGRENALGTYFVRCLHNEKDYLWVGTLDGGLCRYDKKTKTIHIYRHEIGNASTIAGDEVSDIFRDRQGRLWVGTRTGLSQLNENTGLFTNYVYNPKDTSSISNNYVLGMLQDKKGNMWIATAHGLNLMNTETGTFRFISTKDGLPDDHVYGVLEDDRGKLWVSTNNGLCKFDPQKNSFRVFTVSDGLQSKEFNTHAWHKGAKGNLYFGGIGGLNIFHPDSIHDNTYIPPVKITSFSVFGKQQQLDSGIFAKKIIHLDYSENFISFDFASLDFLYPEKNEFACRLEGFDDEWIYLGHRHSISYSNLDPGKYVLHVKATNDDGLWNEKGTELKIVIHPPFYKTTWFYILSGITFALLAWLLYRSRVKNLLKTKAVLEAQVGERTAEIEKQKEELAVSYQNISEISEIGRNITASLNPEEIMRSVYEGVNRLMDGKFFGIALFDEKQSIIQIKFFIDHEKRLENKVIPLESGDSLAAWSVRNQKEIITSSREEIKYFLSEAPVLLGAKDHTESIIMLPLMVAKKCVGIITVQSYQRNAFTAFHVETMRSIASYTAIALDNALLYENMEEVVQDRTEEVVQQKEQLEKAFNNTRLLSQIGKQITSTLDFEEIFMKLYENVNQLMDASCFGIRIYFPERNAVEYSFDIEKGIRSEAFDVPMTLEDNYTVWCIKNNQEIFINDNETEYSRYVNKIIVAWGTMPQSLIFCPLRVGNRVLGVITAQSFSKNAYTDYHRDIMQTLATYAAIAWDNAELYKGMENKVKERTAEVVKQKEEIDTAYSNVKLLSKIGKQITSTLELEKIVLTMYENVNRLMDASVFAIGAYHEAENSIVFPLFFEKEKRFPSFSIYCDNPASLGAWAFNNRKEVIINDTETEVSNYLSGKQALTVGERVESQIFIPLYSSKNIPIGLLLVQSFTKNAYSEYHLNILKSLSVYISIALENAQAYRTINEAKAELEKLSIVAQKTDNGVIICDAEGKLEWVNEGFSRMTGYTLEELKAKMGPSLYDISYNVEIKRLLHECMELKHSVFYEEKNHTKDGREIWVHTSLTPILDENGELRKLVAIDSDISEMKKAEAALKTSEEQYKILFDRNGDFIWLYDKATHFILDCNQTFLDVYGYSKDEIRTMTPFDLHPPEEQAFVAMNIDVESPEIANYYTHLTKSGKRLQVEARSVEIEFNGRHAWLVITRDVTERKKAEEQIRKQHDEIEAKNKDITDSINYAKRIQSATLATSSQMNKAFSDHFIFFRPKDIVSGDFYWLTRTESGKVFLATADCTGHGVPGAIMSVIGTTKLDEIISQRKTENPAEVLDQLRAEIIHLLNPDGAPEETDDGIDMVLCSYELNGNGSGAAGKLEFACAKNPLWIVRDNSLIEFLPDKFCVGMDYDVDKPFTRQTVDLKKGDRVYTFSDGYADQFGGPKGKKFKYKKFQELLLSIHRLPMEEQKTVLSDTMDKWKGEYMQIDDICVIGVCI
jgi:PAS domain S-box-containing protein